MAKDPTASESYIALRNALIAIGGDTSALRSILSALSDGGVGWVKLAYCELRRTLVQGRLKEAETIGGLIGMILDMQEQGIDDELAENRIHVESMKMVTDGIESILAQDNQTGIKHLGQLTEAVYCNESLQWVAWHWLAKAASDEGMLDRARSAAKEAMDLAKGLDLQARGMSHCRLGEIEFLRDEPDAAQEHLTKAKTDFEEIGDRRGMAMALLTLAKMQAKLGRDETALQAAQHAQEADSDWEAPAIFLSQRALVEGDLDGAEAAIKPFFDYESRSPEVDRQQRLVEAARAQKIAVSVLADYFRLRESPPDEAVVHNLEQLQKSNPEFHQLRELLAWNMVKVGREAEAAEHFKAMAYLDLDPELQSSVLLGLGCLANRQFKHRQPSKRVREASSSFQPLKAAVSEEVGIGDDISDSEIPVFEVEPEVPSGPPPTPKPPGSTTKYLTIDDALEAAVEFQESPDTRELKSIQEALDESFEITTEVTGADTADSASVSDAIEAIEPEDTSGAFEVIQQESLPTMVPKVEPKAVFTGDLQLFAVPDLLDFLESSRRTGTLVITSESGIGAVYLHKGRITGAASPNSSNMGDLLMQEGAVSEGQLQLAVDRQQTDSPDRLLGSLLIEMNLVSPGMLEKALVLQVKGALLEMVEWTQGRFAFEPDKREGNETGEVEIELDTRSVLLDVLREHDEANRE